MQQPWTDVVAEHDRVRLLLRELLIAAAAAREGHLDAAFTLLPRVEAVRYVLGRHEIGEQVPFLDEAHRREKRELAGLASSGSLAEILAHVAAIVNTLEAEERELASSVNGADTGG